MEITYSSSIPSSYSPTSLSHLSVSALFSVQPQKVTFNKGTFLLSSHPSVLFGDGIKKVSDFLINELAIRKIIPDKISTEQGCSISVQIDKNKVNEHEGYLLNITDFCITICGHDEQGAFYGVITLLDLLDHTPKLLGVQIELPCVSIHDWPDFKVRGFLLDVSRDKIPSMNTLFQLVDELAKYKINQLQLYFEHAFAYKKHKTIWKKASPIQPEEVQTLDLYCKSKNIELVANQNSLAHMHRWIMHKDYKALAECPSRVSKKYLEKENYEHEGNPGYSFCPTDGATLELIGGLYKELLPNFSSHIINVGLDEPNDLVGGGERSKPRIRKEGISEIYFDYFQEIYKLVKSMGDDRVIQFWADFVITEDKMIGKLPKDVVPLLWGYEDQFPFEMGRKFTANNIQWYVCPSTCSWSSIGGRTDDAIKNLSQAALKGKANGATGYLITEWGDNGHHHPLSVSKLGLYLGARFSWNTASASDFSFDDLPLLLNEHVFHDKNHHMGQIVIDIGYIYKDVLKPKAALNCCSALLRLLVFNDDRPDNEVLASLSEEGILKAIEKLSESKRQLKDVSLETSDTELILQEYLWVIDILIVSAKFGSILLKSPEIRVKELDKSERRNLLKEFEPVLERYKMIWLLRNRKGGFEDSFRRLDHLRELLK
ncbi:MAG: family 20 glycosylhydrolase [Parachlamydiaceae bacterium]|nr:family 20 glycosylhydrolase [Parachlamydiaceae bacterium]